MLRFLLFVFFPVSVFAQTVEHRSLAPETTIELSPKVRETSGLEAWNGWLITHNDSGMPAILYALQPSDGKIVRQFALPVPNVDWEDLAQDSTYFYLADVGNNYHTRASLPIYRIEKKALLQDKIVLDSIVFRWPKNERTNEVVNYNCEALVASSDSLFLFTKEKRRTAVFSLPKNPGHYTARYKTEFKSRNFFATGAYFNEAEHRLVLCGYSNKLRTFLISFSGFSGTDFFSGKIAKYKFRKRFRQVEGIASFNGREFYLTDEAFRIPWLIDNKQQLYKVVPE